MANHSLYFPYSPAYQTSNTNDMAELTDIDGSPLGLFDEPTEPVRSVGLFDDPDGDVIPGDVIGKDIDESLNYIPSIGDRGDTFGADKAGANITDSGRIEYHAKGLFDNPPDDMIVDAPGDSPVFDTDPDDILSNGSIPDDKSLFDMYETIHNYFDGSIPEMIDEADISSEYALPRFKRYPLDNIAGVKRAIRAFPQITNPKDARIAANNIVGAIDRFAMDVKISSNSPLYQYVPDEYRAVDNMNENFIESVKLKASWLSMTKDKGKKLATLNHVAKEEYEELQSLVLSMRKAKDYATYKPLFDKFAKIFHIPIRGTIICDHMARDDKHGGYKVSVTYSNNTQKVRLPMGYNLYHMTKMEGLTELRPQFRGKATTGYMYDRPRIYLSIKHTIPKIIADYSGSSNSTLHKYVITERIRDVYIDPLVWAPFQGAVYVETDTSIKVEEVGLKAKAKSPAKDKDKKLDESFAGYTENADKAYEYNYPMFDSVTEFMEAYGLEPADNGAQIIDEGIMNLAANLTKRFKTYSELKAFWKKKSKVFRTHIWDQVEVDEDKIDKYKSAYKQMCRTDESFLTYTRAFNLFCRLFHLLPETTIIENIRFGKTKEGAPAVSMRYSTGMVKVNLPDDVELTHVSPAKGIAELVPTWKSKTAGKYMYSSPRVFFTIKKRIAANKAGLENTKVYPYTPKQKITTVYIDPTYIDYADGSVFVPTTTPIPVVNKVTQKVGDWFKKMSAKPVNEMVYEDRADQFLITSRKIAYAMNREEKWFTNISRIYKKETGDTRDPKDFPKLDPALVVSGEKQLAYRLLPEWLDERTRFCYSAMLKEFEKRLKADPEIKKLPDVTSIWTTVEDDPALLYVNLNLEPNLMHETPEGYKQYYLFDHQVSDPKEFADAPVYNNALDVSLQNILNAEGKTFYMYTAASRPRLAGVVNVTKQDSGHCEYEFVPQTEKDSEVTPRRNEETLDEAVDLSGKLYPVYIVLFSNDTAFGKMIRKTIHSEFSHATISLDSTMNNMYSFSDIPYNEAKFFTAGFVRESIWSPQYTKNRYFKIFVTFVDRAGRDRIQAKINYFIKNFDKYDYNDIGLVQYYFKRKNTDNHDETKKMKWFCSEFVSGMIDASGEVEGFENVLKSPEDLSKVQNTIDLGKYHIDTFDENLLIRRTKDAEKKFRSVASKAIKNETADDVYVLSEAAKSKIARKKVRKFNEREVSKYTYNVDWKKLYDEFIEFFPKNDPTMRFDLFAVFVRKVMVPERMSYKDPTGNFISMMKDLAKLVGNGALSFVDVPSGTVLFTGDYGDRAIVYPNAKLIENISVDAEFDGTLQSLEECTDVWLDEMCSMDSIRMMSHLNENAMAYNGLLYIPNYRKIVQSLYGYPIFDYFYPSIRLFSVEGRMATSIGGIYQDPSAYNPKVNWYKVSVQDAGHIKLAMAVADLIKKLIAGRQITKGDMNVATEWYDSVVYHYGLSKNMTGNDTEKLVEYQYMHDLFWDPLDDPRDSGVIAKNIVALVQAICPNAGVDAIHTNLPSQSAAMKAVASTIDDPSIFLVPSCKLYPVIDDPSLKLAMDIVDSVPPAIKHEFVENLNEKLKKANYPHRISVDHSYAKYAPREMVEPIMIGESSAFTRGEPESTTPYSHKVEYNWYDPNLMDLKRLPSDEDPVIEPS